MEEVAVKVLVTGVRSGLGQYLHHHLLSTGLERSNAQEIFNTSKLYDVIIHCAFSKPGSHTTDENISTMQNLLKIPHDKFIFISSSDVYGSKKTSCRENDLLKAEEAMTDYAKQKIICENYLQKHSTNYLILRPCGLIGPETMSKNLKALIFEDKPVLTLSDKSVLNFVSHFEVLNFIKLYIQEILPSGIYNFGRYDRISIKKIASLFKKTPVYGNFDYETANLDVSKAGAHVPSLRVSNEEFLRRVANEFRN